MTLSHLRSWVNRVEKVTGRRVPELDGPVARTAACGQSLGVPGTPADGLNSRLVLVESGDRGWHGAAIPQQHQVVVRTGREKIGLRSRGPGQTTDFLRCGMKKDCVHCISQVFITSLFEFLLKNCIPAKLNKTTWNNQAGFEVEVV